MFFTQQRWHALSKLLCIGVKSGLKKACSILDRVIVTFPPVYFNAEADVKEKAKVSKKGAD